MRIPFWLSLALLATACSTPTRPIEPQSAQVPAPVRFSQLRFLAGRWLAEAPDAEGEYLEFIFPDERSLRVVHGRSGSTYPARTEWEIWTHEDGAIVAASPDTPNLYRWVAHQASANSVVFRPDYAPIWFRFFLVEPDLLEYSWASTSEDGTPLITPWRFRRAPR